MANTNPQELRRRGGYVVSVAIALGILATACAQPQATKPAPTSTLAPPAATVVSQATASPTSPVPSPTAPPLPTATSAPLPAPTVPPPPPPPAPTATPQPPAPTATPARAALGRQLYVSKGCVGCHGGNAQGGFGPKLAGTSLTLEQVLQQVRSPRASMPAYSPEQLSDEEESFIYAYYKSLP